MVDELSTVVVEPNRLGIPLNLETLEARTVDGERLDDLIDVDARGDLFEPTERCAHNHDPFFFFSFISFQFSLFILFIF